MKSNNEIDHQLNDFKQFKNSIKIEKIHTKEKPEKKIY